MTDVIKIALDRRAELQEEVTRIHEFIRTAESLLRGPQLRAEPAGTLEAFGQNSAAAPREISPGATRIEILRRGPAVAG